jgi:hypothetical protein
MRFFLFGVVSVSAVSVAFSACSSTSTSGAADAGSDASLADAGHESGGNPFPGIDSGTRTDSGGTLCGQLKTKVDQLGIAARTCCLSCSEAQCNAATNGPCCPVSVTASNTQAVNDYDQAVKAYKAQCNPDCSAIICDQTTPSSVCDGTGASGICQ